MHRPSRQSILGVGAPYATAPAASAGESARRRFARGIGTVVLGLTVLLGWELTPPAVQPVAAACSTGSCATIEVVFTEGTGSGLVTTFPFGIDCTWTGSSRTGTCVQQFDASAGGTAVTLYLDPGVKSYACWGRTCGGLEERMTPTVTIFPGVRTPVYPVFNLANRTRVSMYLSGTGSGRITTSPAGIDCRWAAGARSGTCEFDYWYTGNSSSVTLHRTPDAGSYACSGGAPFCGTPGVDYVSTLTMSPGGSGANAGFWLAVPVTVNVTGSGTVVSNPAGISCGSTCSKWFKPSNPPDDSITLTATPLSGWYLKDWTGACDTASGSTCTFFNGYSGPTIGVVFARLATPAPSTPPTPKPTSTPTSTPSVRPSTAPTGAAPGRSTSPMSTNAPSVGPLPGSSDSPLASDGTPMPGGSQVAVLPSGANPSPSSPTASLAPVPGGSSTSGPMDPMILVLLVVIAVLTLAVGFLLGRRRTSREPPRA